jgi:NADPH-dependent ferric siderophore reductase
MTTATNDLPMLLEEVAVDRVERLSPSFVRVWLGAPALAELGHDGPTYDQRIKLVFPSTPGGPLPRFRADEEWYSAWLALPDEERGHMRTYTIRDIVGEGVDTQMVVDIVVHAPGEHGVGPGCAWAESAAVGDRVVVLAPRKGQFFGGIEFEPGAAKQLLLVGDETAVPAIAAILGQLDVDAVGAAFLEVPTAADVQTVQHPEGVQVVWLAREGAAHGDLLHPAVLDHLGAGTTVAPPVDEVDPDLWETPTYSSSGEAVDDTVAGELPFADLYAWIAGESKIVTGLRRALVKDLGIDRKQVAFMGYWRDGVAMRS